MITQLPLTCDPERILDLVRAFPGWGSVPQIGLRYRAGATDPWQDAVGSLYDRLSGQSLGSEADFTQWTLDSDCYLRQCIEALSDCHSLTLGRVRVMTLAPRQGLSVHRDREQRYHLVLDTNPHAYFGQALDVDSSGAQAIKGLCYNLPRDGHWYKVDTRLPHWVYNAGSQPRTHIVVCEA